MSVIERMFNISETDIQSIKEDSVKWLKTIKATIIENQSNLIRATHEKLIGYTYPWGHWNPMYWKKEISITIHETDTTSKIILKMEMPKHISEPSKIRERWWTYLLLDYLSHCSLKDNEVRGFFTDNVKSEMIKDILSSPLTIVPIFAIFSGIILVIKQGVNSLGLILLSISLFIFIYIYSWITKIRRI